MKFNIFAFVIVFAILITSCSPKATPEPLPTATSLPPNTSTPEPTNTLAPTETLEPTIASEPTNTPEPTAKPTEASNVNADLLKELFVKNLIENYKKISSESFSIDTVSWVEDEFKIVIKSTKILTSQQIGSMQYPLIKSYADAFTGALSEATNSNTVVKTVFTMGDFNQQVMTITKYSTLEKIADGRITTAIEWAQEAEIMEQ
jgi:hypothetical protein